MATAVVALERSTLKSKVIDSPEVIAVIHEVSVCWTLKEIGVCCLCGELCEYVVLCIIFPLHQLQSRFQSRFPALFFLFADIHVLRFLTSSDF